MSPYSQSIPSIALTTLFVLLPFTYGDTQLIINTCKKISQSQPSIPNYETCVNFLQSDPRSKTADLKGLGEISIELSRKKNVAIQSQIKSLQSRSEFDKIAKQHLADCAEMYSDGEGSLEDALKSYREKDYMSANIHVSAAEDAASDCEDGFKEQKGGSSPLTKANNEMVQLCGMSLVFTNMFH